MPHGSKFLRSTAYTVSLPVRTTDSARVFTLVDVEFTGVQGDSKVTLSCRLPVTFHQPS